MYGRVFGIGEFKYANKNFRAANEVAIAKVQQDAQLSQRDRAARCVIVFAKSRTLERGDNDLRIL